MFDRNRQNARALSWLAIPVTMVLLTGCLTADPDPDPSQEDPALEGSLRPNGSISQSAPTPVDWEAEGFAQERGISIGEARQRLDFQARAPRLADRAAADLGDQFGGVWIDVTGGDRIKIGVAGKAFTDAAVGARRAAEAVGLTEGYDLVPVRHSLAALESANDWLSAEIAKANEGASVTLTAGLRTDRNALELRAPTEGSLTTAQRDLMTAARVQLGDMIVIGSYAGRPTARACVYPYCTPPLRGGVRITNSGVGCTGAFIARSKVNSALYQLTAGHCAYQHYDDWSTLYPDYTSHVVGPVWHWEWHSGGDMSILLINNVAAWNPQPWVHVTSGPDTGTDTAYDINADGTSVLGMRICTTGAFYGRSDCGYVTELGVTATYDGVTVSKLGRGSFCGTGGDSGSPMYASHVAYGLQVAGYSECDSLYQGIQAVESMLNVNVLHTP
jgi:hypothetical protein